MYTAHDFRKKLKSILESSGIEVFYRFDTRRIWSENYELLKFHPVQATHSAIDYYLEYDEGNNHKCVDLSSVLMVNKKPVALWPLSINALNTCPYVGCPGGFVSKPYFHNLTPFLLQSKITKACYNACLELASFCNQENFVSNCFDPSSLKVSSWQIYAMQLGASCSIKHEALVDLNYSLEEIRANFRKSYKSLINRSEKLWYSYVAPLSNISEEWAKFKDLHYQVSTRKTRSDHSWSLQKNAVLNNEGFLVVVYKKDANYRTLIGGGFFMASSSEASYAVGAYDRTLFDQPVSHIVQLRAIEELKNRNCEWYHIGRCYFPGDIPTPEKKELSISLFKSGFANHFSCSYLLTHKIDCQKV